MVEVTECSCRGRTDDDGRSLRPDTVTCGACERSWCDRCTPVPAARCPFEQEHGDLGSSFDATTVVITRVVSSVVSAGSEVTATLSIAGEGMASLAQVFGEVEFGLLESADVVVVLGADVVLERFRLRRHLLGDGVVVSRLPLDGEVE